MHQHPRRTLKRLYDRYGPELVADPRRTEALLNDLCPTYRREIFVLVNAQRQQVPAELLSAPRWMPRRTLHARLVRRLQDKLSLTEDAALWAVDAWSFALGQSSPPPARALTPRRPRHVPAPPADAADDPTLPLAKPVAAGAVHTDASPSAAARPTPADRRHTRDPSGHSAFQRLFAAPLTWVAIVAVATLAVLSLLDGALSTSSPSPALPGWGFAGPAQPGTLLARMYPLPRSAWVNADTLNVRSGPSTGDDVVTSLQIGTPVSVDQFSADGSWSHVTEPAAGWVSSLYLNYLTGDDSRATVQLSIEELTIAPTGASLHSGPGVTFDILEVLPGDTGVIAVAATLDGQWRHLAFPTAGWVSSAQLAP